MTLTRREMLLGAGGAVVGSAGIGLWGGHAAAARLIEEALRFVETTPRQRSPIEAPWPMTFRLLQLEAACTLVQVGMRAEGHSLARPALQELAVGRPVEQCLGSLFDCRLRQPSTADLTSGWSEEVVDRLAALGRVERYPVLRVLEHSQVLAPRTIPDAIGGWHFKEDRYSERCVPTLAGREELAHRFAGLNSKSSRGHQPAALKASVGYLRAAARFGLDGVRAATDLMKPRWSTTTDGYSTNTYCSLAVLEYFDGIVFAVAEAVNPVTA